MSVSIAPSGAVILHLSLSLSDCLSTPPHLITGPLEVNETDLSCVLYIERCTLEKRQHPPPFTLSLSSSVSLGLFSFLSSSLQLNSENTDSQRDTAIRSGDLCRRV